VIGARPGLCPFVVRLFQVNLLDCLGFGSHPDGHVARLGGQRRPSLGLRLLGRPLGTLDTQRGRLRSVIQNVARSLLPLVIPVPSGLAPLSGHHHRPLCACARAVDTSRHATATATRPRAQAHDNTSRRTAATATRPCAQAHDNTLRCMAATATRPHAQAHDNTLRRTAATATRPCAQAHDNTSRHTAATTTRTGVTKTTKSSTKPCIHVALHGGDNDNN
jgi:hypothetical protein